MKMHSLLLADDHSVVLEGLIRVLQADFAIVGIAHDGYELMEKAMYLQPDAVVADLSMPGLNAIEALQRMRAAGLRSKFVVLTMHAEVDMARTAVAEGASGYVLKHSATAELPKAVHAALAGDVYVDPALAPEGTLNFLQDRRKGRQVLPQLTPRELEVLGLVAEGRMLKEIAGTLRISESTAGFHKYNMMRKLKFKTTAQLVRHAVKRGLIAL